MRIDHNIKNVKKQVNFQIELELLNSLKELAYDTRRTDTSLIIEGIELVLEKYND